MVDSQPIRNVCEVRFCLHYGAKFIYDNSSSRITQNYHSFHSQKESNHLCLIFRQRRNDQLIKSFFFLSLSILSPTPNQYIICRKVLANVHFVGEVTQNVGLSGSGITVMTDYCHKHEVSSFLSELIEEEELTITNESRLTSMHDSDEYQWQFSGSNSSQGTMVKYAEVGKEGGEKDKKELVELMNLIQQPKIKKFKICKHFETKIKLINCSFTKLKNVNALFAPYFDQPLKDQNENLAVNEQIIKTLCSRLNYDLASYIRGLRSDTDYGMVYAANGQGLYNYNAIYFGKVSSCTMMRKEESKHLLQKLIRNIFSTARYNGDTKIVIPEFYLSGLSKNEMFLEIIDNVFQCISFHYQFKRHTIPAQEIILCTKNEETVNRWMKLLANNYYRKTVDQISDRQKRTNNGKFNRPIY